MLTFKYGDLTSQSINMKLIWSNTCKKEFSLKGKGILIVFIFYSEGILT